jgi:hypothetical protein
MDPSNQEYSRITRPYALTGGRTEPSDRTLALEALVEMTWEGYDARGTLAFESRDIILATQQSRSVAEIAVHLGVPLGVARVLVGDLADRGYVVIHPPPDAPQGVTKDPNLLEKVLDGLRSL